MVGPPGIVSGAFFVVQRIKKKGKKPTGFLYFEFEHEMVKLKYEFRDKFIRK